MLLHSPPRLDAHEGGAIVVAHRIAWLADHCELGILCLRAAEEAPVDPSLAAGCAFVEEIPRPSTPSRARSLRRSLRVARASLPGAPPARAAAYDVRAYHHRVREIVGSWRPAIVQAEHRLMAPYLADVPPGLAKRLLVEHDSQALLAQEVADLDRGIARLGARLDGAAWARFERRTLKAIDVVVALSERDRRAVARQAPARRALTISPVVEVPAEPADPLGTEPPRILFVGMFLHRPNVDAAERLAKSVLPRVREAVPSASLDLVGAHLSARVRRLASEHVELATDVPDLRPYLDRAAVVAVPLRIGSGVRIKVLEALAAGKAVVASPRAAEGIGVVNGEHLVVADRDDDFAAAIVELLRRPDRRAALASAARTWSERQANGEKHLRAYMDLYDELLRARTDLP